MIDKHELRIGNFVATRFGVNKINNLTEYASVEHKKPTSRYKKKAMPYADLQPIELTEDILLKCGFEKQDNNSLQFDSDLGFTMWSKTGYSVGLYYDSDEFGQPVKSLHHLQNVFYFLTGKELQIDLK